ncbi:MAG: hypothetical protein COB81_03780 [Flavobacteriaceae bacterium]|nr:MAG: hypothetical protein COB81_03780 [Flavobacteriaceae bacterium]
MYLEFVLLISDYFKTLSRRIALFDWFVPFLFGISIFVLLYTGAKVSSTEVFKNSSISLLGILAGFSITIITILTTGHSKNLTAIKNQETSYKIGNTKITLFRLLLINFTYSVVLEVFLIIFCLTYPIVLENIEFSCLTKYIGFSVLVFFVLHLLLLTVRNLTDFYLIITKPENLRD